MPRSPNQRQDDRRLDLSEGKQLGEQVTAPSVLFTKSDHPIVRLSHRVIVNPAAVIAAKPGRWNAVLIRSLNISTRQRPLPVHCAPATGYRPATGPLGADTASVDRGRSCCRTSVDSRSCALALP